MTPKEYQLATARTECDQIATTDRVLNSAFAIRLNHVVIGLAGEVGELATQVERWLYYGTDALHVKKVKDELGDCLWYIAQACNTLELDMGEVMEANIRKLRIRYPEKYSDEKAAEHNRNRPAEERAITGG